MGALSLTRPVVAAAAIVGASSVVGLGATPAGVALERIAVDPPDGSSLSFDSDNTDELDCPDSGTAAAVRPDVAESAPATGVATVAVLLIRTHASPPF